MFRVMDERFDKSKWKDYNMVLHCTNMELYMRVDGLFRYGMTWDNYGFGDDTWSLKYIIPLNMYETYVSLLVFKTSEGDERITIEDMCICVNIHPVWNKSKSESKPTYDDVINKCYEIINYKKRYSRRTRCSSYSGLHTICENKTSFLEPPE